MKASRTNALTGEVGVCARVAKAGVKERDQRMRPPVFLALLLPCLRCAGLTLMRDGNVVEHIEAIPLDSAYVYA